MSTCTTVNGSNLVVRAKEETTFGISEQTGFSTIYVKSNSINYTQNEVVSELLAAGRAPTRTGKGNIEVGGALEVAIDNVQTGFWLKQLMGSVSTQTDFVPGKNLHTFTILDTCLPSFQIEKGLLGSDVNYKAVGLKANSLGIEFGGEGEIIGTIDVIGKNEFFTPIQNDAPTGVLTLDYNINTKTITLTDASAFSVGDTVTLKIKKGDIASAAVAGYSIVEVGVGEGANFAAGDFISINDVVYMVKAISGDQLYLSRSLEADISIGDDVFSVDETNTIESISGNDITLVTGIKQNMIALTDTIEGISAAPVLNDQSFDNFEMEITSTDLGGQTVTATVETLSFSFTNNAEAKRLLADKGTVGRILEGKVGIECEMTVLFDAENARFIEEAKGGKEFDIKLEATNSLGDRLSFIMPKGTLTPQTPEISTPTAISVSVKYMPYKTDTNEALTVELLNEHAGY